MMSEQTTHQHDKEKASALATSGVLAMVTIWQIPLPICISDYL